MTRVVALLRAVNVGGRRLKMVDLRTTLENQGFGRVETYLQSGNVVLDDAPDLAGRMERTIDEAFGLTTRVIVRDHAALAALTNPFPEAEPRFVHVVFLDAPADARRRATMDVPAPDVALIDGAHVIVHYIEGSARSKATLTWFERALEVTATARNWNTVEALKAMTA